MFTGIEKMEQKTNERKSVMTPERLKWIISGLDRDDLSDSQWKFVESCEEMMNRKGKITDRMEEVLEDIYREKSR